MAKKILLTLFALAISIGAGAVEFTVNGLIYSITSPREVAVVEGDYSQLTSLTIPKTVTYSNVTYSVTSIGGSAFRGCTGLKSVTIPNSVTSIGQSAFFGCSGLTSVTIPNSVTSIGQFAFSNTAWYDSQPKGLVYAGLVAYEYKGYMAEGTAITLKQGTKGIGDDVFYGCSRLTSVTIPNSVTSIGVSAFLDCTGLKSVTIPNSVTSIGRSAFYGCSGLTSVTIPNSVTQIDDWVFYGCSGLTSVTIPNSVTRIGKEAFSKCIRLRNVTIPNSVIQIGDRAFDCTTWYDSHPEGLVYAGLVAYKYKGTMPAGTAITLKQGTKGIGDWAFFRCSGLTSVTIPDSVTSIGGGAFSSCTGLKSVTIPNSVTSIGSQAFYNCEVLTTINSNLDPAKVTMGSYVFECVPRIVCTLHIKKEYLEAYQTTAQWLDFMKIVDDLEEPDGIETVIAD